jgi:hypothetical protein
MKKTAGFVASILMLAGLTITSCQKDASMSNNGESSMSQNKNNNNNNGNNGNNGNNNNGNNGNNGGGQHGGGQSGSGECKTCFYGHGHWFASGKHQWMDMNGSAQGQVTVGGHHYTMQEGMQIWQTSNSGGKKDSKKSYTMIASIKLSNYCGSYSDYTAGSGHSGGQMGFNHDMHTVETYLSSMGKLSSMNMPSTSMPSHVKQAYERLKSWMEKHECDDDSDEHDD